jgi:tRNA 2-selenouridine synthase
MQLPVIDDYRQLFLDDTPLLDVRAPIEFSQGAFPNTTNIPLIDDEERHAIGIRYAEHGQDQAIALGHELVQGELRQQRINDWIEFAHRHPQGALYCFRGGMRSKISQQWIYDTTGVAYPRIQGGYKALRRYLLEELDDAAQTLQALVIGGRTGVGKTLLLSQLEHQIDLEGIYRHRGSSFGNRVTPQPSQIDIENTLAIALLKHRHKHIHKLVLEDEAPNIGSRSVPAGLLQAMYKAPLFLLEADIEERVALVFEEYINVSLSEYQQAQGEELGLEIWASNLRSALDRIERRLGSQRHHLLKAILEDAIVQQRNDNDRDHHKTWIRALLLEYYDPMYDYQLEKKVERIVFRGDRESVLHHLAQHHAIR